MTWENPEPSVGPTHQVLNQPPPLENENLFRRDPVLQELLDLEGASWAQAEVDDFGKKVGRAETLEWGRLANRHPPELRTHDRFGHRVDEVEFHPAWHRLMALGLEAEIHSLPWNRPGPGAHVARAAKHYLLTQAEAGVLCPITMTFAAVPALRSEPDLAEEWIPRITAPTYDFGLRSPAEKSGCLVGMAMTEKQGGSDVRANTTLARPVGNSGNTRQYRLTGHKWFCSAPMCDAFLTLAQTEAGVTCFLVPRILPDGRRNAFALQRLKEKLGNRSNASSEVEYRDTEAWRVGEEGRGVPTILEMVAHTRLDCALGSAALMRQALAQAHHHASHRHAFGKRLVDQSLMRNVLADLTLEWEAAARLSLRVARSYDEAEARGKPRAFRRIATAISKYWICKRTPPFVVEALECHGGNGYVEESILPRIYREAPLSSIWEGSGNVMCLDVLRAMGREPETVPALFEELERAKGSDRRYDAHLVQLGKALSQREDLEFRARRIVEGLALGLQGALLIQHAPSAVADAFCAARLGGEGGQQYGTLPPGVDAEVILNRIWSE